MEGLQQVYPYLGAVERAIDSSSVPSIKPLFRLDNPLLHQALFSISSINDNQLRGACRRKLDAPWADIITTHLQAAQQQAQGNTAEGFQLYTAQEGNPIKAVVDALTQAPQQVWIAAAFEQMLENAVVLAREADKQLGLVEEDSKFKTLGGFLQPIAHQLGGQQKLDEPGKVRGSLMLLITMTRVYTKLNNMQACTQMLKTFKERYTGNIMRHMPASARVSAYFYLGRTEVSSGHIEQGLQLLEQAFKECPRDSKNMQTILRFLVPLKMLQGVLPPVDLVQQYGLTHYLVFREAIQNGDVGLFQRSMQELTTKMVADGTYLLWDLLIFHVYRRLVKRAYDMGRAMNGPDKAEQISLEVLLGVLVQQGASPNMDELECMLTVAISSKYIKGYLSNKLKVLVLGKQGPFPEPCADWWTPITAENAV